MTSTRRGGGGKFDLRQQIRDELCDLRLPEWQVESCPDLESARTLKIQRINRCRSLDLPVWATDAEIEARTQVKGAEVAARVADKKSRAQANHATEKTGYGMFDLPANVTVVDGANKDPLTFDFSSRRPRVITMSTVPREHITWLWRGRIARALINLIDGDPGVGKSTITIDLAGRVSTGRPMPLESGDAEPADVLLIGQEDHLGATVLPRLVAAGADLHRVHVLEAVPRVGDPDAPPTLADVSVVEALITEKKIALVIIDPLMAHLPSGTDAYRDSDMRALLSPWAGMAQRTGAAILIVRHLRKMGGSALYRGSSSIGIIGAARSALLVGRDPDDPETCVLAHSKGNLAPPAASLRYRVVDSDGVGRIEWLGTADVSADKLAMLVDPNRTDEIDPVDAAADAIREVLASGPIPTKDLNRDVHAMTGASPRTIERARSKLGVIAEKVTGNSARVAGWVLRLPGTGGVENASRPPRGDCGGVLEPDSDKPYTSLRSLQTATGSASAGGLDRGGVAHDQNAATRSPGGVERQAVWSEAVLRDAQRRSGLHAEDDE